MNETPTSTLVWLITGCSRGLGLALAESALARGQRVIATARQAESLAPLRERYPATCRTLQLDVTDAAQARNVVAAAEHAFGKLDVVVNNAGYGLVGSVEEFSQDQIARNFQTNFFGALDVIRAALPLFRAQGGGHIVNISAAAVISNYAGFSIYGASKAALESVSEALAAELKPLGIKVTIVQPGPFRTDFTSHSLVRAENHLADYDRTSGKFRSLLERMSGKQPGDPAKAAAAIIASVESDAPPLRLVLGKYANDKTRRNAAASEQERRIWEEVAVATDFTS